MMISAWFLDIHTSILPSFCQAQEQTSSSCCDNSGPVHLACCLLQGTAPFEVLERIVMTPALHPNHNAMIPAMNIHFDKFWRERRRRRGSLTL